MINKLFKSILDRDSAPDIVITMGCNGSCPYIPCKERCDWVLDDTIGKSDEEFIKTANIIKEKVLNLTKAVVI